MSKVITHMTMSLDGFIADPRDGIDELFAWYGAGSVTVPTASEEIPPFNVDEASAELLRGYLASGGALVAGRRLFDITNGWDDTHPMGVPVVVVTHHAPEDADQRPRTAFVDNVTDGIERAKEIAGDKDVTIASANIAAQALDLGLVDEVHVSLVPVLMGEGIPYFASLGAAPHLFDDPVVTPGLRATHLQYKVRRD
jgi:dihydrofolate reductase